MKAKPTGSHYREMADFRALKTSKQRREVVTLSSECFRIAGAKSIAPRQGDMTPQSKVITKYCRVILQLIFSLLQELRETCFPIQNISMLAQFFSVYLHMVRMHNLCSVSFACFSDIGSHWPVSKSQSSCLNLPSATMVLYYHSNLGFVYFFPFIQKV